MKRKKKDLNEKEGGKTHVPVIKSISNQASKTGLTGKSCGSALISFRPFSIRVRDD